MEQTPFDPFPDPESEKPSQSFEDFSQSVSPPVQSHPSPQSQPNFPEQRYVPPAAPTSRIDTQLPPYRAPRKSPLLWVVPLVAVLLVGGGVGFVVWDKHQKEVAREQKLAGLRADIKKVVLQDNALVMELLDPDALEHITYAEFFERADKNKEARDVLVRQLRATETGPYGEDVGHYVELLEEENKWVRAEEAVSHAQLDSSSKGDIVTRAISQANDADGQVAQSRQAYMSAPYGEDFSEKTDYDIAVSQSKNANNSAIQALDEWKAAQRDLQEKKRLAFVVIADWLLDESVKYPRFAPTRTVSTLLITRKASYAGAVATGGNSSSPADQSTAAGTTKVTYRKETLATTAPEPTETPEPTAPTRTHSLIALGGERFSETRMEDIGEDFASNLSDEDLRYAINEMYARYGMTFKNKSLQSQFEQLSWYHPDDKWTMPQVKAAFSARELANLNILVRERNGRRQGSSDTTPTDRDSSTSEDG